MVWNESFNRVSTFLTALSASIVALALVADATGFDRAFRLFALVLLPIVFFLGVATYVRLTQINLDDVFMVAAMNRLRNAYLTHVPELEPYFTTGWHDDAAGLYKSFLLDQPNPPRPRLHFFITTPTVVATIDALIASAGAGLLARHLGGGPGIVIASVVIAFVVAWAGLLAIQFRQLAMLRAHEGDLVRFPSPPTDAPKLF